MNTCIELINLWDEIIQKVKKNWEVENKVGKIFFLQNRKVDFTKKKKVDFTKSTL